MKRIFNFGKFPLVGKEPYTLKIGVGLKKEKGIPFYYEVDIQANTYNSKGMFASGGDIFEELVQYREWFNNPEKFDIIYDLYNRYTRYSRHAGTPEQERIIEKWLSQGNKYDRDKIYKMLKEKHKYKVNFTGWTLDGIYYENEPYYYGSEWIIHKLPYDVVKMVKKLVQED